MMEWECQAPEHFLFGTVVVRVLDEISEKPIPNLRVAIADTLEVALKKG